MTSKEIFFMIFSVFGGLSLFIFGMNIMTVALRKTVGAKLQRLLSKTTRNRFAGLGLGTSLGTAIHSSATTVMLVGFINAGLMTLEQSIAPMLGSNIGTTLSIQAISFKLSDYCFVAIVAGLITSLVAPTDKVKGIGRAILGFGLLFLGMNIMSDTIEPHREALSHLLRGVDGVTLTGIIIGISISALLTAVWQSSGATLAILFSMINAGVFTQLEQVFPIVLGAHIGTCITSILGSLGANIEAKRLAISHLVFNVFNVTLAVIAKQFFYYIIPLTSVDLLRQTANLHTAVMLISSMFILPIAYKYAKFIRYIVKSKKPMPEPSYLDYTLLEYPERAIVAVINELQRVSKICSRSLYMTAHIILDNFDKTKISKIKTNEKVIDDIKLATKEYLLTMTKKYLSRRQVIMTHHLNKCMIDIERIGDHIEELCKLSINSPKSELDQESFDGLYTLHEKSRKVLSLVIESLSPNKHAFQDSARNILNARDEYIECSIDIKTKFMQKVEKKQVTPAAVIYYREYISVLNRLIRHIESIALAQKHEDFWIKKAKLDLKCKKMYETKTYSINTTDYLQKLQKEDYL